jgi:hypothetical protein
LDALVGIERERPACAKLRSGIEGEVSSRSKIPPPRKLPYDKFFTGAVSGDLQTVIRCAGVDDQTLIDPNRPH